MLLAAAFAEKQLGFETSELIILILILQLVAIGGAFLFSGLSKLKGNKFSLITMLLIWILICVIGYLVVTKFQFYALASFVGLVMGGIQSLSARLIPNLFILTQEKPRVFLAFMM